MTTTPTSQTALTHTDEALQYAICQSCAPVLMGYEGDEQDSDLPRIMEFVDEHGMITEVAVYDPAGYWECESCLQVNIGTGHVFEMEV